MNKPNTETEVGTPRTDFEKFSAGEAEVNAQVVYANFSRLRTQLAQAQQDLDDARNGWESAVEAVREADAKLAQAQEERDTSITDLRDENDRLNTELAQVWNEALERAACECDGLADAVASVGKHKEDLYAYKNAALSIRELKSTNSAEGEPG